MKKKISKLLGVGLTLVLVASLTIALTPVSPVGAADQAWSKINIPSATSYVMPNNITASGPIAQACDGSALFVYINDGVVVPPNTTANKILKSTDGGRTWAISGTSAMAGQPIVPVVAIATSPTEAGVVFYATDAALWWSQDSGATFIQKGVAPEGTITSVAVAKLDGRYIAVVGGTANTYYWDQNELFPVLKPVGTTAFPSVAVALTPTFATDRGVVAIGRATNTTVIGVNVMGGAWGAIIANATIAGATTTAGAIVFPSDFNMTTNPNFFVGITAGTYGGVYRILGGPTTSISRVLGTTAAPVQVASLDISGTFASATMMAGAASGVVQISTNSGVSWTASSTAITTTSTRKGPSGTGNVLVMLKKDYATSGVAFALVKASPTDVNDQSALSVTTDKGTSWNQYSLINNKIDSIFDLAVTGSTMFLGTTYSTGTTISAVTAGKFTITAGAKSNVTTPAVTASAATMTRVTAADNITMQINPSGSVSFGVPSAGVLANVGTNLWTWTGAGTGTLVVTSTTNGTTVAFDTSAGTATVGSFVGGASFISGGFGEGTIILPYAAAAEVDTLVTDTVITGLPATGVSVVLSGTGVWAQALGTITFGTVGETALVTNTGASNISGLVLTATYNLGAGVTTPGYAPSAVAGTNGTVNVSGTWGDSGTTRTFGALAGVSYSTTKRDSVWRTNDAGVTWERVYNAPYVSDDIIINAIRLSPKYATDKTVLLAKLGTDNAIIYSTGFGQVWVQQYNSPGTIRSLIMVLNTTTNVVNMVVGLPGGVKTSADVKALLPWTAATTPITSVALSGDVTSFAVSSTGSTMALGTSTNMVATSTNFGATWNVIGDLTPVLVPVAAGKTFVAFEQGSTSTLYAMVDGKAGIYRYPSITGITAWDRVDGIPATGTIWDSTNPGSDVTTAGTALLAGVASGTGNTVMYAFDTTSQHVARIATQTLATPPSATAGNVFSGSTIAQPTGTVTSANNTLWGSLAANRNQLFATFKVDGVLGLYTYTDRLAVPVSNIQVTATTPLDSATSKAVVAWDAVGVAAFTGPVTYQVALVPSPAPAAVNPYISTMVAGVDSVNRTVTLVGLVPNTTYSVSVWAAGTTPVSFAGTVSFTTPLATPSTPLALAPAPAAINVPILPSFQWFPVTGATSYELWLSTSPTFPAAATTKVTGILINAYVWTGTPLANNTDYYWQVRGVVGTTYSDWVTSVFTTIEKPAPVVTVPPAPTPTIVLPTPTITVSIPPVVTVPPAPTPTITVSPPTVTVQLPTPTITTVQPVIKLPEAVTPAYIWAIVAIGAILVIAVVILIIRTRRVV